MVDPGFLEPLVAKCESNSNIGAVSPKIKYYHHPDTIQFCGQAPMNNYTMRSHGIGHGVVDQGQFEEDTLTHFVHGAAMMVPISVIAEVGLMPECYFLYYEELDWCANYQKSWLSIVVRSQLFHISQRVDLDRQNESFQDLLHEPCTITLSPA